MALYYDVVLAHRLAHWLVRLARPIDFLSFAKVREGHHLKRTPDLAQKNINVTIFAFWLKNNPHTSTVNWARILKLITPSRKFTKQPTAEPGMQRIYARGEAQLQPNG